MTLSAAQEVILEPQSLRDGFNALSLRRIHSLQLFSDDKNNHNFIYFI